MKLGDLVVLNPAFYEMIKTNFPKSFKDCTQHSLFEIVLIHKSPEQIVRIKPLYDTDIKVLPVLKSAWVMQATDAMVVLYGRIS